MQNVNALLIASLSVVVAVADDDDVANADDAENADKILYTNTMYVMRMR